MYFHTDSVELWTPADFLRLRVLVVPVPYGRMSEEECALFAKYSSHLRSTTSKREWRVLPCLALRERSLGSTKLTKEKRELGNLGPAAENRKWVKSLLMVWYLAAPCRFASLSNFIRVWAFFLRIMWSLWAQHSKDGSLHVVG